jgi:hypothetical protein
MSEKKTTRKDERVRNWSFVVYPESAPENWQQMLDDMNLQWIVSPLHDKCVNEDGTPKKHHWHVALIFEGNKSFEQIKEITDSLNAPIPQKVNSMIGIVRYMAHMDNPEKAQYSQHEIKGHGGADVAKYLAITATSRYAAIGQMIDFINERKITEFYQLMLYAKESRFYDWFPLLCDNSAYVIGQYIRSVSHKHRTALEAKAKEKPRVIVVNEDGDEIEGPNDWEVIRRV